MKKTIIGIALLLSGILIDLSLIFTAITYLPNVNRWSTSYPSKLWFLIFAGKSKFADGADGLGLGLFFICGILLAAVGILMLLREYFSKQQ